MPRKHSPGPWMTLPDEADKSYVRIRGSLAGSRFKVANVLKPIYENPPEWEEEETRANVRLIEAAPELLESAIAAEKVIDILWVSHHANRSDDALEKLRAAIAKATGT